MGNGEFLFVLDLHMFGVSDTLDVRNAFLQGKPLADASLANASFLTERHGQKT